MAKFKVNPNLPGEYKCGTGDFLVMMLPKGSDYRYLIGNNKTGEKLGYRSNLSSAFSLTKALYDAQKYQEESV